MTVQASIIICTYNRYKELYSTLQGLARQTVDNINSEIIIVDNACDEKVENLLLKFDTTLPNLVYILEPKLGLSYARNRGVKEARGDWIIFLDDDAIPEADWLQNLFDCIDEIKVPSIIGGRVQPSWTSTPPDWLRKDLYPALSISLYKGEGKYFILDFPLQYPVGANIVYHKTLIQEYGGFDPRFGRYGNLLLSGEETILNHKIWMDGNPIFYCPDACVNHIIPSERLKKDFYRSRYYWDGRTKALITQELFGRSHLQKEILKKLTIGLTIDLARYFYYGLIKCRVPLIFELYLLELFGFIYQGINISNYKAPNQ